MYPVYSCKGPGAQTCDSAAIPPGHQDFARTGQHVDDADALLAQEVADLDLRSVVLDVGVDGEVGIHQPHLVLKAQRHALYQILRGQASSRDYTVLGCGVSALTRTADSIPCKGTRNADTTRIDELHYICCHCPY